MIAAGSELTEQSERPVPPYIDITLVVAGTEGRPPIALSSIGEKIHLLDRSLADLPLGTPIGITSIEERDRVKIVHGEPLADRVVVQYKQPHGDPPIARMVGRRKSRWYGVEIPDEMIGFQTTYDFMQWSRGQTFGHQDSLFLIRPEFEEAIQQNFVIAEFIHTVGNLGINLLDRLKPFDMTVRDDRVATELLDRFKTLIHQDANVPPMVKALNEDQIGSIFLRHVVPQIIFLRECRRREYTIEGRKIEPSIGYLWRNVAQTYATDREFITSDEEAYAQCAEVLDFLLNSETVLPGPNDALSELPQTDMAREARDWARYSEEARAIIQENNFLSIGLGDDKVPSLSESDLALLYVTLGRAPVAVEEIPGYQSIRAQYPANLAVEGLGDLRVRYEPPNKYYGETAPHAKIELRDPRAAFQVKAFPTLPSGSQVKLAIYPEAACADIDALREMATRIIIRKEGPDLLKKAFADSYDPKYDTFSLWQNTSDNEVPTEPPGTILVLPDGSKVRVLFRSYYSDGVRIVGSGIAATKEEVQAAEKQFEQACKPYQDQRKQAEEVRLQAAQQEAITQNPELLEARAQVVELVKQLRQHMLTLGSHQQYLHNQYIQTIILPRLEITPNQRTLDGFQNDIQWLEEMLTRDVEYYESRR